MGTSYEEARVALHKRSVTKTWRRKEKGGEVKRFMRSSLILVVLIAACAMAFTALADDERIVWVSDRAGDGRLNLWAMNPDGTHCVQLTTSFVQAVYPSISPEGTQIAFSSQDTGVWYIYLIDADGSNLTQFTDCSSAVPHWSPDGERLIFNSDHDDEPKDTPDLWAMDLDGSNLEEIVDKPPTADFNGQWSPDGKRILFVSNRDGDYNLYVIDVDGTKLTRLTDDPSGEWSGRWSPDGSRILFISDRTGNPDLFIMDADGSNVVQVTDYKGSDIDPAWSPDGNQIVFMSDRSGNPDLWIIGADGSDPTQVTDDKALDRFPDWR